jgi:hypothetical protein
MAAEDSRKANTPRPFTRLLKKVLRNPRVLFPVRSLSLAAWPVILPRGGLPFFIRPPPHGDILHLPW